MHQQSRNLIPNLDYKNPTLILNLLVALTNPNPIFSGQSQIYKVTQCFFIPARETQLYTRPFYKVLTRGKASTFFWGRNSHALFISPCSHSMTSPHLKNDPLRNSRKCLLYQKPLIFLVRCGADTKIANKAGDSAYDLAVKSGNDSIIEKFTTNLGQELLQKLTKTKTPS